MASAAESQQPVVLADYLKAIEDIKTSNKVVPQKDLMTERWVAIMIQRINSAKYVIKNEGAEGLHKTIRDTLKTFDVEDIDGKDSLIMKPVPGVDTMPKIIVPLEKTYELLHKAHVLTNHGTADEMENWIYAAQYVMNKMCVPAYHKLCSTCNEKELNEPIAPEPAKVIPVFESTLTSAVDFKYVVSLDVLNLTQSPDVCYNYLLIYEDQRNKFVQLRPLNTLTEAEVSIEVVKIFMDFGPPHCILVEPKYEVLFHNTLDEIKKLARRPIKIALRQTTALPKLVETVENNLKHWMKEQDCGNWGTGCHIVQWIMNNNLNKEGVSPFSLIFGYKSKSKLQRPHDQPVSDSSDGEEIDPDKGNSNVLNVDEPLKMSIEIDDNDEFDLNPEDDEVTSKDGSSASDDDEMTSKDGSSASDDDEMTSEDGSSASDDMELILDETAS